MATTQHRWTRIIKQHQAKELSLPTGSKRESTEMKKDKAGPWPRLTFLKNTKSWWTVKALIFQTPKTTPSTESSVILTTTCPKHKIISIFVFIRSYGKGANKADQFAKTGRKQQLVEQMVLLLTYFLVFATNHAITASKVAIGAGKSKKRCVFDNEPWNICS